VHNNYYFLRQLTQSLQTLLTGTVISECFSQNKDELIIRFETHNGSSYLKASLTPTLSCLSFPTEFHRARKNSVDLFPEMIGHHVTSIRQSENERSFLIALTENKSLLFKMHGNRANIILFQAEGVVANFRKNLDTDVTLSINELDRQIDWSFETFQQHEQNLPALYFTFGKIVWQYLDAEGFKAMPAETKWHKIQGIKATLEQPKYFLTSINQKAHLVLIPFGDIQKTLDDPITAANEFFYTFTHSSLFDQEKNSLITTLRSKISGNKNYILKNNQKRSEIGRDSTYKVWADLIMANLHAITPNAKKVVLQNFYNDNIPLEIKLKADLSPQKNAEIFYKKAKNQQIEIDKLKESIDRKVKENEALENQLNEIEKTADLKSIREAKHQIKPITPDKQAVNLPYHEFIFKGYKIWVGKNAESNDILTLKLSYKEDLWLHAKDVAGSHVLIKHQAGKPFPKDVIERAAELAAYNSKRKTDTLCPVVVTPKKFVRKRKGDPAGAMVVEREDVLMVTPRKP
jgi:predicted ribosome quality control (RQC) complex YloA/Tae2 family protein